MWYEMFSDEILARSLMDNAGDALYANYLTHESTYGNFLEVSAVLCERLGYSHDELIKLDPYVIHPSGIRSNVDDALKVLKFRRCNVFDSMLIDKNQRKIPVEISMRLFDFNDRAVIVSIARDTTRRNIIQRKRENYSKQLRDLATRLQEIREEERAMVAREIHDDLGQNLTVLKMQLALLCDRNQDLHDQSQPIFTLIDQIVDRVQKISSKLRPDLLDELGLIPAIEWHSNDFQQSTGIRCDCRLPQEDIILDRVKATAAFRIFQEALINVARHAHATRVSINFYAEEKYLLLEITDNGIGISEAQINDFRSLGLLGMRERAMTFGGELTIRGVTGKGTNLKLKIPRNQKKELSDDQI